MKIRLGRQSTFLQEKDGKVLQIGPAAQESCVAGIDSEGCVRFECLVGGTLPRLCLSEQQLPQKDLSSTLL